jgi:hypothetical protein
MTSEYIAVPELRRGRWKGHDRALTESGGGVVEDGGSLHDGGAHGGGTRVGAGVHLHLGDHRLDARARCEQRHGLWTGELATATCRESLAATRRPTATCSVARRGGGDGGRTRGGVDHWIRQWMVTVLTFSGLCGGERKVRRTFHRRLLAVLILFN